MRALLLLSRLGFPSRERSRWDGEATLPCTVAVAEAGRAGGNVTEGRGKGGGYLAGKKEEFPIYVQVVRCPGERCSDDFDYALPSKIHRLRLRGLFDVA